MSLRRSTRLISSSFSESFQIDLQSSEFDITKDVNDSSKVELEATEMRTKLEKNGTLSISTKEHISINDTKNEIIKGQLGKKKLITEEMETVRLSEKKRKPSKTPPKNEMAFKPQRRSTRLKSASFAECMRRDLQASEFDITREVLDSSKDELYVPEKRTNLESNGNLGLYSPERLLDATPEKLASKNEIKTVPSLEKIQKQMAFKPPLRRSTRLKSEILVDKNATMDFSDNTIKHKIPKQLITPEKFQKQNTCQIKSINLLNSEYDETMNNIDSSELVFEAVKNRRKVTNLNCNNENNKNFEVVSANTNLKKLFVEKELTAQEMAENLLETIDPNAIVGILKNFNLEQRSKALNSDQSSYNILYSNKICAYPGNSAEPEVSANVKSVGKPLNSTNGTALTKSKKNLKTIDGEKVSNERNANQKRKRNSGITIDNVSVDGDNFYKSAEISIKLKKLPSKSISLRNAISVKDKHIDKLVEGSKCNASYEKILRNFKLLNSSSNNGRLNVNKKNVKSVNISNNRKRKHTVNQTSDSSTPSESKETPPEKRSKLLLTKQRPTKENTGKKQYTKLSKLTKQQIQNVDAKKIPKVRLTEVLDMIDNDDHPIWADRNTSCNPYIYLHWEQRVSMISDQNMKLRYARQFLLRRDWFSLSKILCLTNSSARTYYPLLSKYAALLFAHTDKDQFNKFIQFLTKAIDSSTVMKKCTNISKVADRK